MNLRDWISTLVTQIRRPQKRRAAACLLRADELESRMLPSATPIVGAFASPDTSARRHGADDTTPDDHGTDTHPEDHPRHQHHEHHGHHHK